MAGLGNSSPIVSRGRVFLTTSWGQHRSKRRAGDGEPRIDRVLTALDLETGERLWERVVFTTLQERRHHMNTPAGPTPVADDERVYVYFGMGLAAYDYDGELVWEREVDPHYLERSRYGVISSPVLAGDAVIAVRDDEWGGDQIQDISWLAAYDRRTGRELWRSENDETCCSYATPVLFERGGEMELVFPSTPFVAGYDLETGERLWTGEHGQRQIVPSPLLAGDLLFLPGSVHRSSMLAMRLTEGVEGTAPEPIWHSPRSAPKIPSPVSVDGLLYVVTDGGVLNAFDLETGEQHYAKRLASSNYRASLAAGGGKLYAISDDCTTSVVRLGRKFRLISENELPGRCAASPALADGAILIRTDEAVYCIDNPAGGDEPVAGEQDREKKKKGAKGSKGKKGKKGKRGGDGGGDDGGEGRKGGTKRQPPAN